MDSFFLSLALNCSFKLITYYVSLCFQMADNKLYVSMLENALSTPYLYFSYTYDLTHTLQRLHNITPEFLNVSILVTLLCFCGILQSSDFCNKANNFFPYRQHFMRELTSAFCGMVICCEKSHIILMCIPFLFRSCMDVSF